MTGQPCIVKTIYLIGLIIFIKLAVKMAYAVWDLWLAPKKVKQMIDRFGLGSYVVITGTTAGIGRSLAKDFVNMGFNIVQISRNAEKLAKVEKELLAINPKVKIVTCVLDLANCNEKGFFDELWAKTEALDISIVVNNAGIDCLELFQEMDTKLVYDMVNINVNAVAYLTKLYMSKLNKRQSPTAVICLSSLAGTKAMSYFNVYCATKAFVEMFCESMNKEHPRT
jgi:short-subunit dehydrogenase